ncbi:MAG: dynamin family protein [Actinomycetota bacterium]|nr:dynamin family protein [Actinomycetota bacterium]
MPASELIERVAQLISDAEGSVPDDIRSELELLQARLREPARVAVVGRVKAGKSTLVNAMLAQRVAPTDVSECTRVVTWFRYGHPQRVVIHLKAGGTVEAHLDADGALPADLGVASGDVASVQAFLANDALRSMTLIDTPGIGSVHPEYSMSTEQLVSASSDSLTAAAGADALVFLLNRVMMEDEMKVLQQFRSTEGEGGAGSAAATVGVLSRADQLGDGGDPWEVAVELANHYAGVLRDELATVVPVIGLLAETAEAATLTEMDAKHLATLAAMEQKEFSRLLWSADRFATAEAPVPSEARERLLVLLDLYGVQRAVGFVRGGARGAVALRRELSNMSGIGDVKRTLSNFFHENDHVLKVRSALAALERLSYPPPGGRADQGVIKLRADVEALRLDPIMQPIAELEVWHDCCTGRISMPEEYTADMRRLFTPGSVANRLGLEVATPDAVRVASKERMVRWRRFMVTEATPIQGRVARVVLRSLQLLWEGAAP